MPVFEASDSGHVTIHDPSWDEDETVTLRRVTYADEKRAQGKAIKLPAGVDVGALRSMPEAEVEKLLMESTDAAAVDLELMRQCIVSWTLRRAPSREQQREGERGLVMPLSVDAISALPPAAGEFIRSEIERLRDVVPAQELVGPKGDDFRPSDDLSGQRQLPRPGRSPGKTDAA